MLNMHLVYCDILRHLLLFYILQYVQYVQCRPLHFFLHINLHIDLHIDLHTAAYYLAFSFFCIFCILQYVQHVQDRPLHISLHIVHINAT
jgi:hypothetical protein